MNEVIKQLYERKSVRVFEDKEISNEDKWLILESAAMAPTAGNQQLYTILDITNQELKEMFSSKTKTSIEEWMKMFCERKFNSDFSREMSRSVDEYLKKFNRG